MSARPGRGWPWLVLAVGLALMLPGLARLWQVEQSNDTYELLTADGEILALEAAGLDRDLALDALQAAGLRSVSVEMMTLTDLDREGRAALLTRGDVLALMAATGREPASLPGGEGLYVSVAQGQEEVLARIRRAAPASSIRPVPQVGEGVFFITGLANAASAPLGFDDALIARLTGRGLAVIARVPAAANDLEFVTDELERLRDAFGVNRVLFSGETAPFAADTGSMVALATWMQREGFSVMPIEFFAQPGIDTYVRLSGRGIRLHGLGIADLADIEDAVARAVRGVKERNIRAFLVRPTPTLAADVRLDQMVEAMSGIVAAMPSSFRLGLAEPFEPIETTPVLAVGGVLAAAGIGAAGGALLGTQLAVVLAAGMAVLAAGHAVTGSDLLGDLTRLGVAGMAAVLATFVARPRQRLGAATLEYLKALAVVIVGGVVTVGLAYRNDFLVGSADFFGVKALLIGPPIVAAGVAAYHSLGRPDMRGAAATLSAPIRVWHVVSVGLAVGVVAYLALRSDNTGAASDLELIFRQQLEDLFWVRPRTKEFLIGLPALLMGIVLAWRWRHAWWLYAVAAIGTASAVDTFTHFHAPLLASGWRTVTGFALGYGIGLIGLFVVWGSGRLASRTGLSLRR